MARLRLEETASLRMGPAELKQAFSALGVKLPNSSKAFQQVSYSCPMFPFFPVSSGFTSPSDRLRSGVGVGLLQPLAVERNPPVCPRAWVALILTGTQARIAAPSGVGPVMHPGTAAGIPGQESCGRKHAQWLSRLGRSVHLY